MASIILPKPGSKFGPCFQGCMHRDCIATRAQASRPCKYCGKQLGYGVDVFEDSHFQCALKEAESEIRLRGIKP